MSEDAKCVICLRVVPRKPPVCDSDRQRESRRLSEIANLHLLLPAALDARPNTVIDLTQAPYGGASARAVRRCARCGAIPGGPVEGRTWRQRHCRHDRPEYHDDIGDISAAAVLDSWVRDWVDTLGATDPPRVPTVTRLAMWLQIWLPLACDEHPAIDEYSSEIRHLAAAIRRALNHDLSPVRYEAPCPYCGTKTLRRKAGGDWIECVDIGDDEGCHRLWGEDEYGLLARAAIHDDEMLSTEEAAMLAGVEPGTIRVWAHRGKLTAHYHEGDLKPWYRKGDVQDLAERST